MNVFLVNLRKTYLQVCIAESLRMNQKVVIQGRRYCLMCLGFGLNMVHMMMKAIVEKDNIKKATSVYIQDIFVNENIMLVTYIKEQLLHF